MGGGLVDVHCIWFEVSKPKISWIQYWTNTARNLTGRAAHFAWNWVLGPSAIELRATHGLGRPHGIQLGGPC